MCAGCIAQPSNHKACVRARVMQVQAMLPGIPWITKRYDGVPYREGSAWVQGGGGHGPNDGGHWLRANCWCDLPATMCWRRVDKKPVLYCHYGRAEGSSKCGMVEDMVYH